MRSDERSRSGGELTWNIFVGAFLGCLAYELIAYARKRAARWLAIRRTARLFAELNASRRVVGPMFDIDLCESCIARKAQAKAEGKLGFALCEACVRQRRYRHNSCMCGTRGDQPWHNPGCSLYIPRERSN